MISPIETLFCSMGHTNMQNVQVYAIIIADKMFYWNFSFGNVKYRTIYPNIPAMAVPNNTPNFACPNISASFPKERLAINKETVKPMPPNKLIPARLLHVIPFTKVDNRLFIVSQVNK